MLQVQVCLSHMYPHAVCFLPHPTDADSTYPIIPYSMLLGSFSILAAAAFVARVWHLRAHRTLHHLGRTAWVYWPTQVCMGLACILSLTTAWQWHGSGMPAAVFGYYCFAIAWVSQTSAIEVS